MEKRNWLLFPLGDWSALQIKNFATVVDRIAIGQFIFLAGKQVYLKDLSDWHDWGALFISVGAYIIAQVCIHTVLAQVREAS
jgi:hypothetical protein